MLMYGISLDECHTLACFVRVAIRPIRERQTLLIVRQALDGRGPLLGS